MAHSVRLTKPWLELTTENIARAGGHMGVYELADANRQVVRIGYAGGSSLFGLAGELASHLGAAASFRYEVTTAYMSRYQELLMVHRHDHGRLPVGNDEDPNRLGRISPA